MTSDTLLEVMLRIREIIVITLLLAVAIPIYFYIMQWYQKRKAKINAGFVMCAQLTIRDNGDVKLLVNLIHRCIAYGDYVSLKCNQPFEVQNLDKPRLYINVCGKQNKDIVMFQSEVEGTEALLAWYRITRENNVSPAITTFVEFNKPEPKGGGLLI